MVSDRSFNSVSMAVDAAGSVHAVIADRRGLVYLTNLSGTWTRQQIGTPAEDSTIDKAPSIAIDHSGALAVAYARSECHIMGCFPGEILVTRQADDDWQTPETVDQDGRDPSLAYRDGILHVAYFTNSRGSDIACGEPTPLVYATDAGGQWTTSRVAANGLDGEIEIAADGFPRVAFDDLCGVVGDAGVHLARGDGDGFAREAVPGTDIDYDFFVDLATDGAGSSHVLYEHYDVDGVRHSLVASHDGSDWSEAIEPMVTRNPKVIATSADGTIHVASIGSDGIWHAANASGAFLEQQVSPMASYTHLLGLAVDVTGRPHILFGVGADAPPDALWYGVGVAP